MPTGGGGGGVRGYPVNLFQMGQNPDSAVGAVTNKVIYSGFGLLVPVTFANLAFNVSAADGVNNSDIGIYSADGSTLLANIGAQHLAATGAQSAAITQTTVTLFPGRYIFAMTSAAATLALNRDQHWATWCNNGAGVGASVGGALPANIPAPAVAIGAVGCLILSLYT